MRDEVFLRVQDLVFAWPSQALFTDFSFDLPSGVSLLHGDESCGKTTLLRLLAGELLPQAGDIQLLGEAAAQDVQDLRDKVFRTEPRSSALDAISATAWWATLAAADARFDSAALPALAAGFALDPHLEKPMYMLSAGSKRKVWLCAALACGRPLTLMDEPLAALDLPSSRFLISRLNQLAALQSGRAWLLADFEAPAGLQLAAHIAL